MVHRNNLLGGKLQVRSPNKNQVYGFKSQNITNNIKDILLKLNKKEPISFKDVNKLNEQEKNQLYLIVKKLHVRLYSMGLENSQLFFEFRASDPKNNLAILWAEFLFLYFQCEFVQIIALASPLELCRSSQGTTHRWRWLL